MKIEAFIMIIIYLWFYFLKLIVRYFFIILLNIEY